jgi:hypothetical protein
MTHSMLSLPRTWPENVIVALILEAAGLPEPAPPDMPRAELVATWKRFHSGLHAAEIRTRQGAYVAVWLEAGMEEEVDAGWGSMPERGFWLHAVALGLCLAAVRKAAPEAAAHGCASLPGPDPELAQALRRAGLECDDPDERHAELHLGRRYAVVTHAVTGGCGVCALAPQCPRPSAKGMSQAPGWRAGWTAPRREPEN